jgi:zinc protease
MKNLRTFFLCLLIAVAPAVASHGQAASVRPAGEDSRASLPALAFEKYTLANGLEVILSENHRVPLVAVNIWYHVGPANERAGRTGFAHLFEHMMFEGSEHVGAKAHFRYLDAAGATGINATTSFDRTNYFETLPSNQLELGLWLESDRMGYLLGTLDQEKLQNQKDVVRNERRQTTEGAPYGLVEEEVYHRLFPESHPYYGNVIGSHADIEAARLDDVRDFFREYYTPNNASLAIVGDFDPAAAKQLVAKYFGSLVRGPVVPKIEVTTPSVRAERRAIVTDRVEFPRVYMAWLTPAIYEAGDAESDVLAYILGGGKSSRLYKRLVHEKQIAEDVSADNSSLLLGSVFEIEATAKPGVKPEELQKAIDGVLAEFRSQGPSAAELVRARNVLQTGLVESLESFSAVANRLNQYNQYRHDPGYLETDFRRYSEVTAADLKRAAGRELSRDHRVLVYGVPGEKVIHDVPRTAPHSAEEAATKQPGGSPQANGPAEESWRKTPPQAGPTSKLSLPVASRFSLASGLTVFVLPSPGLPIVSAELVVLAGSAANPLGRSGLASFTVGMLDRGTSKRSALEISDDLDEIGAALETDSGTDSSTISITSLKKNLEPALEIFSDVALSPSFPEQEIEHVRSERLGSIQEERDSIQALARQTMASALYGDQSPYGFLGIGDTESNKKITREDLGGFWKREYVPANSALVLAGDISEAEALALAEKYFGSWTGARTVRRAVEAPRSVTRAVYIVDKPESPQTQVRVAALGAARSTPDYVSLEVMNEVLGGSFASRLNMNLREEHGYTYGVSSGFTYTRETGTFSARGGIRTDVTAPAVAEIFREIERIRNSEPTPAELELARNSLSLSLPALFRTNGSAADTIGELFVDDLPLDYYQTLPSRIEAVSAGDVMRMAQKYLGPGGMVVVAAGDRGKIEPGLKNLNAGPIAIVP